MKRILVSILLILFMCGIVYAGVDLNGDADYINIGDVDIAGGITIALWVNSDSFIHLTDHYAFVAKRDGASINYAFGESSQDYSNPDEIRFYFNDGSWHIWASTDGNFSAGTWYHIAVTYDETNDAKMYKNGSAISVTRYLGTANGTLTVNDVDTYIGSFAGGQGGSDKPFNGQITEVAIWDSVLTAPQIALLSSSRLKRMPLQIQSANLQLYLPMDDHPDGSTINGKTYKDMSGNGNDGTGADVDADSTNMGESILNYPPPIMGFN